MQDIICKTCGNCNDYRTEASGQHLKAICNACNSYIKFLPQSNEFKLYFGKYKDRLVSSLQSRDELFWLQWAIRNINLKPALKDAMMKQLEKNQIGV